eukprot:gene33964-45498_t
MNRHFKDTSSGGEILFITHEGFIRTPFFERRHEWIVIWDEFPQVDQFSEFNIPNTHDLIAPSLDVPAGRASADVPADGASPGSADRRRSALAACRLEPRHAGRPCPFPDRSVRNRTVGIEAGARGMSVVTLEKPAATDRPVTGSGMDRSVTVRRLPRRLKLALGAAVALLAALGFWWFMPHGNSQTVGADRLTISPVRVGTFEDFVPLRARVTPLLTVFLDSIEGGRVEKVVAEDGTMLAKGQLIAVLSNAELQLSTLARQTEVEQQINNMRSQELALAQTRLANERAVLDAGLATAKARRQYEIEAPLAARGFVAGKQFNDTRDQYLYQQKQVAALQRSQATDERLQISQLAQQRASTASMQSGLALARADGFLLGTGTHWDSWSSVFQKFLEDATATEATKLWLGKPAAIVVSEHCTGGKGVLSRLQGVLVTLGCSIPPMSGLVLSRAAVLAANHAPDPAAARDFWCEDDLRVVCHNLAEAARTTLPAAQPALPRWRTWPVDRRDFGARWL